MRRIETKEILLEIINDIDEYRFDNKLVLGHPALFLFKTKEELNKKIDEVLQGKDEYDESDILYLSNYLINFLLGASDSHTKALPINKRLLPIVFKFVGDDLYVLNVIDEFKDALYGKLISVNGVPIDKIVEEFIPIVPHSTMAYLKNTIMHQISKSEMVKCLPPIDSKATSIEYEILKDGVIHKCKFDLNKKYDGIKDVINENYTYDVIDNILVIRYSSCQNMDKMIEFINEISKVTNENGISKVIVDIRGNEGGNSGVSEPLLEFLKDKEIVTLTNEEVFSSGVMLCARLKQLGSYFIGTEIGSTLCCFGDCSVPIELPDYNLRIFRSLKYFLYDKDLNSTVYMRNNFSSMVKSAEEFTQIDKGIISPDEVFFKTIDDYKNGTDRVLLRAIEYIKSIERK